ncbi:hypothetical protein DFH09DRAFT_42991 [Mycena vulgaris]|nr:hypothetical protein DFH09DRAFT_42991 [Mycena vulgaris]
MPFAPRAAPEAGKDEFGRDIRPPSPSPEPPSDIQTQPLPPPPPPAVRTQTVEPPSAALTSNHDQMSLTPSVDANTSSRAPDAAFVSNKIPAQGMENFSLATFDFTAPSSWEALGKMWQVTHGYLPSTEQLMEFVMSGGTAVVANQQAASTGVDRWTRLGGHTERAAAAAGDARSRRVFERKRKLCT